MQRPDIQLLRAKVALMSPFDCPPSALRSARKKYPDALKVSWIALPATAPDVGLNYSKSSGEKPYIVEPGCLDAVTNHQDTSSDAVSLADSDVAVFGGLALTERGHDNAFNNDAAQRNATAFASNNAIIADFGGATGIGPQRRNNVAHRDAGPRNVTKANDVYIDEQQVVLQDSEVSSNVGNLIKEFTVPKHLPLNSIQPSSGSPYLSDHVDGRSECAEPAENNNKHTSKDIVVASDESVTKTLVPKISVDNYGSRADEVADKRTHHNAVEKGCKSGMRSAKRGKVSHEPDVIVISDNDDDFDVAMTGTNGEIDNGLLQFEPRYVVVDAVGWKFREWPSMQKAVRACYQVMPPIDAGNGVKLFINDKAHALTLDALRSKSRELIDMRGERNKLLMRTERRLTKLWLTKERGCVIDSSDKMWDFSPLWYLFKVKIAEIKEQEEEKRRHANGGDGCGGLGGGSGGAYGGVTGYGGGGDGAFPDVDDVPAGGVVDEGDTEHSDKHCSEEDMAWLRFEDEE
ncbi:Udp-glc gal endoplasmic reticulum nucleotide sugar transporter protein [Lasiodiplodia theobromae]|uniref:Udp-glc gal endoplasmic reticulum nucleotide sugar transporter protein n=1 Tax=Lasiodiplodia theobromae TaxID=45133 RepID=UPI0015C3F8E1|nr:Udp-glc gal endoplasmic reticulum nucleotide sugar transporter protein [Lasiodiplodia theobromae]KAF4539767.1 Udp-glc gal endoplasmic reticulum nucleotide sugar transporter protein [Lasiodiplodia theobromae]